MDYLERTYRNRVGGKGLVSFHVCSKESDLLISVDRASFNSRLQKIALSLLNSNREQLEKFLAREPAFGRALEPYSVPPKAPRLVRMMAGAAARAGVGPMAAVAGAIAEAVGRGLLRYVEEVIVENGGDIFLKTLSPRTVGIFAGTSPLSERVGLLIQPCSGFYGICTSSGTVGPSLSFGRADAAVVVSSTAALADAVATALGNRVQTVTDFPSALSFACQVKGILGAVVIQGEKLGAMGNIELVPLAR